MEELAAGFIITGIILFILAILLVSITLLMWSIIHLGIAGMISALI